ncbi:MAG TPA: lytic transglycosylase domain-containing protein [Anaerolineae bacterium]|jgi:soluble lytic murein transglycosylase|nr:lytic transglycosylase domain-containing protein [Anaerolineae bacterium]
MRLSKFAIIIILLPFVVILWYQWSHPSRWEQVLHPLEYKQLIVETSRKYSIDPYLISAIIYEESKFNPSSRSKVGAVGLMQVMPDTGAWIAKRQGRQFTANDLYSPEVNINMGCWYFNFLRDKYRDEKLALAAYNSGDKNVDRWLRDGEYSSVDEVVANIPYKETRTFVKRVLKTKAMYEKHYPEAFKKPPGVFKKPVGQ